MEDIESNPLGQEIHRYLQEHSLSLRQFAAISGVHVSTLSRLANGKRRATGQQLRKLAPFLPHGSGELGSGGQALVLQHGMSLEEIIVRTLGNFTDFTTGHVHEDIVDSLKKYEVFSQTPEGEGLIVREFPGKISQVAGIGPLITELQNLFERFQTLDDGSPERPVIGSALLYFILSADAIPDYLFPIGYLDDALAIQLVMQRLNALQHSRSPE